MNMNKFETYISRAEAEYQAGFKSKAAQDRACSHLNSALELVVAEITGAILDRPHEEREGDTPLHNLYWDLCGVYCRNFVKKSAQVIPLLGEMASEWVALGEQCVALYTTYKAAEIKVVPASPVKAVEEKIQKTIKQMMEDREEKFNRCLKLESLFGTMGVTANVHLVFGHKGTVYVRAFYYVMGVLTPLHLIIAAMEESARNKLTNS